MKKRMFITTIVMMLVLAVALTTSSLAWFSSANVTVTAQAATFTAATANADSANLKISDTTGSWGNTIRLTDGTGATMSGLVPTAPLISELTVGADIATTGVTVNGAPVAVTHKGYKWPATMEFNLARIGSESNFIIEASGDNGVKTYNSTARDASTNYYFDYFYIQNAGTQNTISTLTFNVTSKLTTTGTQAGDYTAKGYVAFILFDMVNVASGETTPSNALIERTVSAKLDLVSAADLEVIDFGETADEGEIAEDAAGKGLNVWVPFCAFTFCTDKGQYDTVQPSAWQFADLDATYQNTNSEAPYYDAEKTGLYYNNKQIDSLNHQDYDALTTIDGGTAHSFVLNTAKLKDLNNKVVNASGNVVNTGVGNTRTSETDWDYDDPATEGVVEGSIFVMQPHETFLVSMYYWLDGQALTEFTDTTVSEIGVTISAN